jgi:hypothetical protein
MVVFVLLVSFVPALPFAMLVQVRTVRAAGAVHPAGVLSA